MHVVSGGDARRVFKWEQVAVSVTKTDDLGQTP
jgi:hypothetical protein